MVARDGWLWEPEAAATGRLRDPANPAGGEHLLELVTAAGLADSEQERREKAGHSGEMGSDVGLNALAALFGPLGWRRGPRRLPLDLSRMPAHEHECGIWRSPWVSSLRSYIVIHPGVERTRHENTMNREGIECS